DDVPSLSVDHQPPADRRGVAAKAPLPVPVRQDDSERAAGRIVPWREAAAEHRRDVEDPKNLVCHEEGLYLLRLAQSGDARGARPPQSHALERPIVLAIGEIEIRRGWNFRAGIAPRHSVSD